MNIKVLSVLTLLVGGLAISVKCFSLPPPLVPPEIQFVTDDVYTGPTHLEFQHNREINGQAIDSVSAIKNLCGISMNLNEHSDLNLKNFCLDSFKGRNEFNRFMKTELSDDVKKCYSFLCAWYHEKCHQQREVGEQKCGCLYNLWSQCGCNDILNSNNPQSQQTFNGEVNNPSSSNTHIDIRFGHNIDRKTSSFNIPLIHSQIIPYQRTDRADIHMSRMASDDPDAFIFTDDENDGPKPWEKTDVDPFNVNTYNEEERKCFALKQVWFNNQCANLKTDNLCGPGEWLVLKKPTDDNDLTELVAICVEKKCKKKDEVWWASENRCMVKSDVARNYCKGKDVLVEHDSFGDGFCTCYDDSGSFENSNDCYEFYQKGPCKITQVVTYNKADGYATCTQDLCFGQNHPNQSRPRRDTRIHERDVDFTTNEKTGSIDEKDEQITKFVDPYIPNIELEFSKFDRLKRQTNTRTSASDKKFYAPFGGDGECYKFGPQPICDKLGENAQFKFHKLLKVPECFISTSIALHLIDSRPGCKVDENNNCRQEVKLAQTSELDYLLQLKNQARKKRDTRRMN